MIRSTAEWDFVREEVKRLLYYQQGGDSKQQVQVDFHDLVPYLRHELTEGEVLQTQQVLSNKVGGVNVKSCFQFGSEI